MAMPQDFRSCEHAGPHGRVTVSFSPDATSVELEGEVDLSFAEALDFVAEQAAERETQITVDLSGVTFMDSVGLTLLIRLAVLERRAGRQLRVIGATAFVRDLIRIAGLDPILDVGSPPGCSGEGLSPGLALAL